MGCFYVQEKESRKTASAEFITLDDLVPQNHILRLIDKAIDISFIYDEVDGLYAAGEKGRSGIAPAALFKIIFIPYLFPQHEEGHKGNLGQFRDTDIFEHIFQHILSKAFNSGFVDASAVFIDDTHIKASANKHKSEKIKLTKPVPQYKSELDRVVGAARKKYGKKPFERSKDKPVGSEKTVSMIFPDSGMFVKGEHERQMAYVAKYCM